MAITPTPRFGLKQFSSGADPHPTRLEHNAMIAAIESNAAITSQGTLDARPTAGKVGRIYWATDSKRVYYDDGMAWSEVSPIGGGGAGKALTVGGSATEGVDDRAARADHTHNVPLASATVNGAMSAADKKKLDAATASATPATLAFRTSTGAVSVATPTAAAHATTKAYVDGRIQEAATYADDAVYAIPFASATEYGHMTADDKKKLDAATSAATGGALIKRSDDGFFITLNPTAEVHAANKRYVDAETAKKANASHSHGAADLPAASITAPGTMSAADKKKLDAATGGATPLTLAMRNEAGQTMVGAPTASAHAATKGYVDAETAKKANASHSHAAADLPVASATAPGLLSAADKAKLNAANSGTTASTLVMRADNGFFQALTPTTGTHVANKNYVDAETAKRALASHSHAAGDLPAATTSAAGTMSAADKTKLDAATYLPTYGTLVRRHETYGTIHVETGTGANDAVNKGYVDGETAKRALASHKHAAGDLPVATSSAAGTMSAADKAKLDGAESTGVASRIMMRDSAGRSRVATPSHDGDIAPKAYVDTQVGTRALTSHNHSGANITSGTVPAARLPLATASANGIMVAADKAKLDAATSVGTASTLLIRDSAGRARVANPSNAADIATKSYVDAADADRVAYKGSPGSGSIDKVVYRGVYPQPSGAAVSLANGYPTSGAAGCLVVQPFGEEGKWAQQEWTAWSSNRRWIRSTNDGGETWRGWDELIRASDVQARAAKSYVSNTFSEPANSGTLSRIVLCTIQVPDPGWPYHIMVYGNVEASAGGTATRWDVHAQINGTTVATAIDLNNSWFMFQGQTKGAGNGAGTTVDLIASKVGTGTTAFGLSSYNRWLNVMIIPAAD